MTGVRKERRAIAARRSVYFVGLPIQRGTARL
jgi:hypothetical protein